MNYKRLFCTGIMFLLCGCNMPSIPAKQTLVTTETTFSKEVFDKGGRALVIMEAYNNVPSSVLMNNYFKFQHPYYGEFLVEINNKENLAALMLVPGTYNLTNYYLHGYRGGGNNSYSSTLDYKNKYAADFKVKPGEVVYIGKVDNKTVLGEWKGGFFSPAKREAATNITVTDDSKKLSPNLLSQIELQTGKKLEVKLLNWHLNNQEEKK